ncbi:MAG: SUMF1/EgtB/PvdO family nonheme iron enzyme [Bryobacterales bacterium]|nr:SUMF1/EgtB/PvdO family nonheme iron enzyme [Bryobacterales bacterium]
MSPPTEAQWEYAARAGSREARYGRIEDIAWYKDNSGDRPKGVGEKTPNAWKLYDMLGNAWEWTADWYGETYYQAKESRDPQGPPRGTYRGLRGGAWFVSRESIRVSVRGSNPPEDRHLTFGFRCAGD